MHGLNRVVATCLGQFCTQVPQVTIHRSVAYVDVRAINRIDQLGARHHMLWPTKQLGQQLHLSTSQGYGRFADAAGMPFRISDSTPRRSVLDVAVPGAVRFKIARTLATNSWGENGFAT